MKQTVDFSALAIAVVEDKTHTRALLRGIMRGFGVGRIFEASDGAGDPRETDGSRPGCRFRNTCPGNGRFRHRKHV